MACNTSLEEITPSPVAAKTSSIVSKFSGVLKGREIHGRLFYFTVLGQAVNIGEAILTTLQKKDIPF